MQTPFKHRAGAHLLRRGGQAVPQHDGAQRGHAARQVPVQRKVVRALARERRADRKARLRVRVQHDARLIACRGARPRASGALQTRLQAPAQTHLKQENLLCYQRAHARCSTVFTAVRNPACRLDPTALTPASVQSSKEG